MELWLVLGTWALVGVTIWVARQQSKSLRDDLKVRLQLRFSERFDSRAFVSDRIALAKLFLDNASHMDISESVLNFFEDLGLFSRRGYLDEELIWHAFGFYVVRWWAACKDYVLEERRRQNDETLFTDFEDLASRMRRRDIRAGLQEPSSEELGQFLEGESTRVRCGQCYGFNFPRRKWNKINKSLKFWISFRPYFSPSGPIRIM